MTRTLLLFLCFIPAILSASVMNNSGSMVVGNELAIGFPEVNNTGTMQADLGNFAHVERWYDNGTLSFKKAFIDHEAIFTFDNNTHVHLESSGARITIQATIAPECTVTFSHANQSAITTSLHHNDGAVTLGVADPAASITVTMPTTSTLSINAPSDAVTLDPAFTGGGAATTIMYDPYQQALPTMTMAKKAPSPKKPAPKKKKGASKKKSGTKKSAPKKPAPKKVSPKKKPAPKKPAAQPTVKKVSKSEKSKPKKKASPARKPAPKKTTSAKPALPSEYYERLDAVRLWQAEHLAPALGVSIGCGALAAIVFGLSNPPGTPPFSGTRALIGGTIVSSALGALLIPHALKKRPWVQAAPQPSTLQE